MTTLSKRNRKYTYFIGVDISKNKLDFAVFREKTFLFHTVIKNEKQDILDLVDRLKQMASFKLLKTVFCMENTGFYGNHLLNTLNKLKANIVQEHPLRIKKSMGTSRGKDDKLDAIRIAEYAWKNRTELKLWVPRRPIINELAELMTYRNRLSNIAVILKTAQKEGDGFISKAIYKRVSKSCESSIAAVTADQQVIEQQIKSLIASDSHLKRMLELITSVPFIGFITGVNIIISTNEYKDITNPRKFACYVGIAPFPKESGGMIRKRKVSHLANKKIKALLHICAIGAGTRDPELKAYFNRKKEEGKHKISIFNAVRCKLVLRVFACLRQDRLFTKHYQPAQVKEMNMGPAVSPGLKIISDAIQKNEETGDSVVQHTDLIMIPNSC